MKRTTQTLMFLAVMLWSCQVLYAQNAPGPYTVHQGAEVSQARLLGKTAPLREIAEREYLKTDTKAKAKESYSNEMPNFGDGTKMPTPFADQAKPYSGDPLVFFDPEKLLLEIEPQIVIEGMDESDANIFPPDPNGDIGLNYYIQMINSGGGAMISIFDKETGEEVLAPMNLSMLWQDLSTTGFGDGIVLFDQENERWVLTEFGPLGTTVILMAISETSDPFGSYFAYEFQTPNFPDYPKFGIWNDAIMITTNEGGEDYMPVYLLERDAMINGEPFADAQLVTDIPKFNPSGFVFQTAAPVDWDGNNAPPAGSPQYMVRMYDDAWAGGADAIEVWEVTVDWNDPNNTSVAGPIVLPTEPFDSDVCNGSIFNCLEQFGGGTNLSAIMQVIMNRPQYRNFGTHESIVLNFTVDVNGSNQAGIRWVELRKSGGTWAIHQEGTFAPDTHNYFMGSIAMDGSGNILMGYSITSLEKELSLRYTGRLAGDPLGEMTVDEFEFAPGESAYGSFRWGDYASMNIDPIDDRTFWFTGEYMKSNQWGTKIMSAYLRRDSNDIGPQARILPQNSQFLGNAENVSVAIRNNGWLPAQDFSISYQFENDPLVTEIVSDTIIQPDSIYVHTFGSGIDVSVIGDYDLVFISSMANDTLFANDTLRTVVSKLTRYDAGISDVGGLEVPLCESDFEAEVLLRNYGQDTLTSVEIVFSLNGGMETTINWTGNLPFGNSEIVPISSPEPLQAGTNELLVYTQLPNGVMDEDVANDTLNRSFQYIENGVGVRLELLTDNYPSETSWELYDMSGSIIYSGDGYAQQQTLFTEYWCLEEGCYTFVIYDSFGDGIQFGGIEGGYQIIREEDDAVLAEIIQINFGQQESNSFCTDVVCLLTGDATISNVTDLGLSDGAILIEAFDGTPPYQYSIDGGGSYSGNALFENLPAGIYEIVILDDVGCESFFTVEVETCTLLAAASTTNSATSNSNDGTITITGLNGTPPYQYSVDGVNFVSTPFFDNLPPGTYQAVVVDAVGCTKELTVTVGVTVGTESVFFGYELNIYPNPTPNVLTIELSGLAQEQTLWYDIFDVTGRRVKSGRLANYSGVLRGQVSLKELSDGQYYLRFNHPEFRHMVKVQKMD